MSRNTAATRAKTHKGKAWFYEYNGSAGLNIYNSRRKIIATIQAYPPKPSKKAFSNANLISSAPELLAMLKEASEHLDYCGYGDDWERECATESKLRERIKTTISKACPRSVDTPLALNLTKTK